MRANEILTEVRETILERNGIYGQNDEITGQILAVLFPDGVKLVTPEDHRMFHFLGHIIGKLTRFTNSGMKHEDSIHDLIGYAALAATLVNSHNIEVLLPKAAKHGKRSEIPSASDFAPSEER